jgi:hypothetical protein
MEMGKLLKEYPRADPLQPLNDHAHINMRPVRRQHVNVVACDLAAQYADLVFHGNLPYQVAHTKRDLPRQYFFPVFGDPYKEYL